MIEDTTMTTRSYGGHIEIVVHDGETLEPHHRCIERTVEDDYPDAIGASPVTGGIP